MVGSGGLVWIATDPRLGRPRCSGASGAPRAGGARCALGPPGRGPQRPAALRRRSLLPTQGGLTDDAELGNLIGPLSVFQYVGIWPNGDFRLDPVNEPLTVFLIALGDRCGAAAPLDLLAPPRLGAAALRRPARAPAASPSSSTPRPGSAPRRSPPAAALVLLLALGGAAAFALRVERVLGTTASWGWSSAGVLWSNALGYHDVSLAPYDQLRGAGEHRRGVRRRGADADDRIPALRRPPLPPRGRRRGGLGAARPRGAAGRRRRTRKGRLGRHRPDRPAVAARPTGPWSCAATPPRAGRPRPTRWCDAASTTTSGSARSSAAPKIARAPAARRLRRPRRGTGLRARCCCSPPCAGPGGSRRWPRCGPRPRRLALGLDPPGRLDPDRSPAAPTSSPTARGAAASDSRRPPRRPLRLLPAGERPQPPRPGRRRTRGRLGRGAAERASSSSTSADAAAWLRAARSRARPRRPDARPGSGGPPEPIGPLVLSPVANEDPPVPDVPAARAQTLCGKDLDWVEALP